jgi:holo-[acyl-carrier protein] synthase
MGLRVGIDLASTDEIADGLERWGERYTRRLFTDGELQDAGGDPCRLAARFAAKEAAIKVLAPDQVLYREIELRSGPGGALSLMWSGTAALLAAEAGVSDAAVSITHDGAYAAAVVVALTS